MSTSEAKARPDEQTSEPQNVNPPGTTVAEAEALERLVRLNELLRARTFPEPAPVEPPPVAPPPSRLRGYLRPGRIFKTVLALVVAAVLLWVPVQRLLYSTSAQATINARLINLRAPIDGTASVLAPSIAVGTLVKPGEPLLQIDNSRASRQRLDDLRRSVNELRSETGAREKRLAQLKDIQVDVKTQLDAFQNGRIRQLEARQAELTAEIASADATLEDAKKSLARSEKLKEQGYQTLATLVHAERDYKVAVTKVDAAHKRLESNKIELDAARKGLFVGDSYNDLPRSAQRLDEVDQQIVELTGQLGEGRSRLSFLDKELSKETEAFASDNKAVVTATVEGRIWETLTANGEDVRKGQDLLRVLDCAGAVVTATVSENVYNKLWIGQPVEFRLLGRSEPYAGSVAGLTGLTAAASNFAIEQTTLTREPYHVTIAVPGLAAQKECNVGRTGSVVFGSSSAATAAAPALTTSPGRGMEAVRLGRSGSAMFEKASAIAAALTKSLRQSADSAFKKLKLGLGLS